MFVNNKITKKKKAKRLIESSVVKGRSFKKISMMYYIISEIEGFFI